MSNYQWTDKNRNERISVGFDRRMNTFFAQIQDLDIDDNGENEVLKQWLGGNHNEFPFIGDFLESIPFQIPKILQDRLEADRQGNHKLSRQIKLPSHIEESC